jgi:hypothetical protein
LYESICSVMICDKELQHLLVYNFGGIFCLILVD